MIRVPCFDFSAWLRPPERPIVKFDVEGAEVPILENVHEEGTDSLVAELLVEWHDEKMARIRRTKGRARVGTPVPRDLWEAAKTTLLSTIRGRWRRACARGGSSEESGAVARAVAPRSLRRGCASSSLVIGSRRRAAASRSSSG